MTDLKHELLNLRVQKNASGAANKIAQIKIVRKSIARVNTISTEKSRADLKVSLKNAKRLPLDMRPKLTRAMRRRLSKDEARKVTLRQHKKNIHFSNIKFAVRA